MALSSTLCNHPGPSSSWILRSTPLSARERSFHLARSGVTQQRPGRVRSSRRRAGFLRTSSRAVRAHRGSIIACTGDSMSPSARTRAASVAPTRRPTSIPSVNSSSICCSSVPDLPAASNRRSSKPLRMMTYEITFCLGSRQL